jgi:hypothetical protein
MTPGKRVSLFALDCGATNWRLYKVNYRVQGNLIRILGEPQPSPLTSFSERKLPAIITLNPEGTALSHFGEVALGQLEDETTRAHVREYFKPCIGAHLEENPLLHQKRYTHAQALEFTRMLLEAVVEQIRNEKWRASAFDESVWFSFAYPVHWKYDHQGTILEQFTNLVLGCFPEAVHEQIRFVPEPEGAILSLKRQGLLTGTFKGAATLIVDVGGSTTDIVAGKVDPESGDLLYLGHFGKPFGGGLYDVELAKYLADELNIPASTLADDPSAMVTLRLFGQRLKESLSRQLMRTGIKLSERSAQRMITLVTRDGSVYRRLIQLDEVKFTRIAGHLDQTFADLIDAAMESMSLEKKDIGQVALVGGGGQLFSVIRILRERFGTEKVVLADSPDEIVVQGVGLEFGAALGTLQPGVSLVIETPQSIEEEPKPEPHQKGTWQLISESGQTYPLKTDTTSIGRSKDCSIWLESEKVSRIHANVHIKDGKVTVVDTGSTNGTHVNGARIAAQEPHLLQPEDTIRFGNRIFNLLFS